MKKRRKLAKKKQSEATVRRWWHRWHWRVVLGVATFLLLVILVQLFYPADKTLPFTKVADTMVGGLSSAEVAEKVRLEYNNIPLRVRFDEDHSITTTTVKAGLTPDYHKTAYESISYTLVERLVPFSMFYIPLSRAPEVSLLLDDERFEEFAASVTKFCYKAPVDSSLQFKNGEVTLRPASLGQSCGKRAMKQAVLSVKMRQHGGTATVATTRLQPKHTDQELSSVVAAARQTVTAGLTIASPNEKWVILPKVIASWLTTKEEKGVVKLTINQKAVKAYLSTKRTKLHIEPGITKLEYENGHEVSRTPGKSGQGIDVEVSTARVVDVLMGRTAERIAWVRLTVLPPKEVVIRGYAPNAAGLQALLEQWDRENGGQYGIIVRDLAGHGMSAALNPDKDFVPASTFKMFLAYAVLHKIETGNISMETATDQGLSVRACLDEMILHSTNACATSFFNLVGWDYAHTFIRGQFPNTSLNNGASGDNEKHTTVRDETDFLERLNAGRLMNKEHSSYLLDLMKRQIYRSGTVRGVPGLTVANKVGFYNGYKHDVAIIYASRGTYLLGIMSYGGSDGQFADLSRKVYELMKQN